MKQYTATIARLLISAVLCCALVPSQVFAASHTLYLTPATTEVTVGTSFVVNVKGYVGERAVSKASGALTFPTNLLQVTGTSNDNSDYGRPSVSQSGNTINFSASTGNALSGQVHIFAVTFRAVASGTASVGFSAGSAVNSDAANTVKKGGSFKINAPTPTPTCPAGQVGTPPHCSTPAPAPAPKPTPPTPQPSPSEPTPPEPVNETPAPDIPVAEDEAPTLDTTGIITDVAVRSQYTNSTVTWKTSEENITTKLSYGPSREEATTEATVIRQPDGSYQATAAGLQPGTRSYFSISGTAPGGKSGSYIGTIITKGYPVTLSVQNNNAPAAAAAIKLGQRSYTATEKGTLNLALAAGTYSGTVTIGSISKAIKFTVESIELPEGNVAPKQQAFSFSFAVDAASNQQSTERGVFSGQSIFAFIGVLLGGTAVLAIIGVGILAYRRRKFDLEASGGGSMAGSRAVVVHDTYDWDMHQQAPSQPVAPPPPITPYIPQPPTASLLDEEPKDMFDLAQENDQLGNR